MAEPDYGKAKMPNLPKDTKGGKEMSGFLMGFIAGVAVASTFFGYLTYHLYKLFKYQ